MLDSDLPQKEYDMRSYGRLTLEHRYQIKALKDSGLSIRKISTILMRSASTISRELRREPGKYYPKAAQEKANLERSRQAPRLKIQGELEIKVQELIGQQWSPEQVSGRLRLEGTSISYETIYKYIYQHPDKEICKNLRRKRRSRRSRATTQNYKGSGFRVNQSWIEDRPSIVEERSRIGDFERDFVLGKDSRILTIVDRKSKLTKIKKVAKHSAYETHMDTVELLSGMKVHTITNDNGAEFSLHCFTGKVLNAQVYFARPYCSWQRGTVENTNGLIRQYYPKGTNFNEVTDQEIAEVERRLNSRPRKTLGYLTPYEVHSQLSQSVALGS